MSRVTPAVNANPLSLPLKLRPAAASSSLSNNDITPSQSTSIDSSQADTSCKETTFTTSQNVPSLSCKKLTPSAKTSMSFGTLSASCALPLHSLNSASLSTSNSPAPTDDLTPLLTDSKVSVSQEIAMDLVSTAAGRLRRRGKVCGKCEGCTRKDCRICRYCIDKPKYGGIGKRKQRCLLRVCSQFRSVPGIINNNHTAIKANLIATMSANDVSSSVNVSSDRPVLTQADTHNPTSQPDTLTLSRTDTQTPIPQPGTQTAIPQPDTQTTQPGTQTPIPQPGSQTPILQPDTQTTQPGTQTPIPQPGTQTPIPQPDTQTPILQPDTETTQPGTETPIPQPGTQTPILQPDTQTLPPGTQTPIHPSTLPSLHNATQNHFTTTELKNRSLFNKQFPTQSQSDPLTTSSEATVRDELMSKLTSQMKSFNDSSSVLAVRKNSNSVIKCVFCQQTFRECNEMNSFCSMKCLDMWKELYPGEDPSNVDPIDITLSVDDSTKGSTRSDANFTDKTPCCLNGGAVLAPALGDDDERRKRQCLSSDAGCRRKRTKWNSSYPPDISKWTVGDVKNYLSTIPECAVFTSLVEEQGINGMALLLLTHNSLVSCLGMKLGPALKVMAHIDKLKEHQRSYVRI